MRSQGLSVKSVANWMIRRMGDWLGRDVILLELMVYPVIYQLWRGWEMRRSVQRVEGGKNSTG